MGAEIQKQWKDWAFLQVAPDLYWIWRGEWSASSSPQAETPSVWFSDFFLKNRLPWLSPSGGGGTTLVRRDQWLGHWGIDASQVSERARSVFWEKPREAFFEAHFETLQEWIEAGVLKKGVPVASCRAFFREDSREDEDSLLAQVVALLTRVPQLPSHLHAYGFCKEGKGFIGATPEVLFALDTGRRLTTMALAGTQRTQLSSAFGQTSKDQSEHFAVVEDIEGRLDRLAIPGTLRRGPTEVLRFGILEHLHTPIEAELPSQVSFEQLLLLMHPTAALGVHPRVKAGHRWLDKMDAFDRRESFGAPFGAVFPDGSALALVAIRQIQFDARGLKLWAGAGVVAESQLDKEWSEILLKMESICRTFDLPGWKGECLS